MPLSEESTLNTRYGTFTFFRLPQCLRTSPDSSQLLVDKVLSGLSFISALCCLDDVCIVSGSFEQHLHDVHEVLHLFRQARLKHDPQKSKLHPNVYSKL